MTLRCDVANLRLFGKAEDEVYLDVAHRCMQPSCENCWKPLHNKRTLVTRLELKKIYVSVIWLGLLSAKDRRTARHYKERHSDCLYMLSTYTMTDTVGVMALQNMIPSRDVMTAMPLEAGLQQWHEWGLEYRPKRVRADWPLTIPGGFRGMFVASRKELNKAWELLSKRYGYTPGDVPEDSVAFERRMYGVLQELRNPDGNVDGDSGLYS